MCIWSARRIIKLHSNWMCVPLSVYILKDKIQLSGNRMKQEHRWHVTGEMGNDKLNRRKRDRANRHQTLLYWNWPPHRLRHQPLSTHTAINVMFCFQCLLPITMPCRTNGICSLFILPLWHWRCDGAQSPRHGYLLNSNKDINMMRQADGTSNTHTTHASGNNNV